MNELKAWLHWALNETQVSADERAERIENMRGTTEFGIVLYAAELVSARATRGASMGIAWCLEHHPIAFRDLSLALHAAVEAMHAVVPEAPPRESITDEEFNERNYQGPGWWNGTAEKMAELVGIMDMHRTAQLRPTAMLEILAEHNRVLAGIYHAERKTAVSNYLKYIGGPNGDSHSPEHCVAASDGGASSYNGGRKT